jgi:hypothetical protein
MDDAGRSTIALSNVRSARADRHKVPDSDPRRAT